MNETFRTTLWRQFGAAIDMLENAIRECPQQLWCDLELMLYNMRHVQHHAAQLNLILRQKTDSAPAWVGITKSSGGSPDR